MGDEKTTGTKGKREMDEVTECGGLGSKDKLNQCECVPLTAPAEFHVAEFPPPLARSAALPLPLPLHRADAVELLPCLLIPSWFVDQVLNSFETRASTAAGGRENFPEIFAAPAKGAPLLRRSSAFHHHEKTFPRHVSRAHRRRTRGGAASVDRSTSRPEHARCDARLDSARTLPLWRLAAPPRPAAHFIQWPCLRRLIGGANVRQGRCIRNDIWARRVAVVLCELLSRHVLATRSARHDARAERTN
jgi:hypothetical protein